jgi:hypothetical protein
VLGPTIVSAERIGGNGLASVMLPVTWIVIVRPGVAVCSASRSEPGPESAVVVTTTLSNKVCPNLDMSGSDVPTACANAGVTIDNAHAASRQRAPSRAPAHEADGTAPARKVA